jgi:hypothetical protein
MAPAGDDANSCATGCNYSQLEPTAANPLKFLTGLVAVGGVHGPDRHT